MATQTTTIESGVADAIQLRKLGKDGSASENNMASPHMNENVLPGAPETTDGVESRSGTAEETHDYPTGIEFWFITIILGALLILGALDTNIVATAVPRYG
jgi:hypothetical protein